MRFEPRLADLRVALIDLGRGTRIGPQRPRYARTQWLAPQDLAALQEARLGDLLAWARVRVPFYRGLAADGGLPPEAEDAATVLRALPVLRKADLRADPERYRPDGVAPSRVYERRTGGSTGDPLHYRTDARAISGQWAALLRAWEWSGWRFGEPMVTVGGGSVAPVGGGSLAQRAYDRLRRNVSLPAAELDGPGLDLIVDRLRRLRPALVYGYPSLLYRIARRAGSRSGSPLATGAVITTSEMLFPGQRRVLEEVFGTPVFDVYGCNETNLVAGECEHHDGRHLAMESCFVEILDDQDRPVPPGTVGRIVATALDNRATAFLRYETGDLGALDERPCACGRGLVRIRDLQGRSRDLVHARDGRHVHGVAFNEIVLEYPWVDRYQVVQETTGPLAVTVATTGEPPAGSAAELARRIEELTGLEVRLALDGAFVVTPGAKARVIISRLEDGHGR